jgi:hypothetical protein
MPSAVPGCAAHLARGATVTLVRGEHVSHSGPCRHVAGPAAPIEPIAAPQAQGRRSAFFFLLSNAVGFLAFTLTPLVASLVLSLFAWPLTGKSSFVGFSNYINLFSKDPTFPAAIVNTLYYGAAYVPLNVALALGVALLLKGYSRSRRSCAWSSSSRCSPLWWPTPWCGAWS